MGHGDGLGTCSHEVGLIQRKRAIATPQENGHGVGKATHHRQIRNPLTFEVLDRHGGEAAPHGRQALTRSKRAVGVAEQDGHGTSCVDGTIHRGHCEVLHAGARKIPGNHKSGRASNCDA